MPNSQGMPVLDGAEWRGARSPSMPEMSTVSALALTTPQAMVPTPAVETSLTLMRALGLARFRS